MRRLLGAALAVVSIALGAVWCARRAEPAAAATLAERSAPPPAPVAPRVEPPVSARAAEDSVFSRLPPLRFSSANQHRSLSVRLYDAEGRVDEATASALDELLADARDPEQIAVRPIDRRTLQLVVKAAYHFKSADIQVISAYRKPGRRREGPHGRGTAIDFKLGGVPAKKLASYLRTQSRVGVGIYTHPRTQFVHLDVREQSFHWLDASPPGKHWRERSIGGRALLACDAHYARRDDWPEGTSPPPKESD